MPTVNTVKFTFLRLFDSVLPDRDVAIFPSASRDASPKDDFDEGAYVDGLRRERTLRCTGGECELPRVTANAYDDFLTYDGEYSDATIVSTAGGRDAEYGSNLHDSFPNVPPPTLPRSYDRDFAAHG